MPVGVAVMHAVVEPNAAQVTQLSKWTAGGAAQSKRTCSRNDVSDHATSWFAPFAVAMCGCMGKNAVWLVVGDNGDESRHVSVSKGVIGVIVRWALQLLSVTVRGGGGSSEAERGDHLVRVLTRLCVSTAAVNVSVYVNTVVPL